MIRPQVQFNLASAKAYFREHLGVGDYYSEGQAVTGEWFGQGAAKLGLTGVVGESAFLALCDGKHPQTDERLTPRLKSVRQQDGKTALNRRVNYDFTISPPKSVSIVALYQDARIVGLHDRAVRLAMTELEKFAETRVRKAGKNEDRATANLVAAFFRHDTSRELDPHLHTHCVVFNATHDAQEGRWKALQAATMYRAVKFAQEYYRHELCKGLRSLGYSVHSDSRGFEIVGLPQSLIARFSKRHQQIDEEARKRLERHGFKGDINALREQIAHGNRRRKMKGVSSAGFVKFLWTAQMAPEERRMLGRLQELAPAPLDKPDLKAIVEWADQRVFERRSVAQDFEIMSAALGRGRGQGFNLSDLAGAIEARGYVHEPGTRKLTSREVLGRELAVVLAATDGRNRHAPLAPAYAPHTGLSDEQTAAVRQILGSRDFITLFRGAAGTGKSRALSEVVHGLATAGRPVVVLAPQNQQVLDLQRDGLPAQTVAHLLTAKQLPPHAVFVCDEAGQISGRDLHQLVGLVKGCQGRLILSGDTGQHGPVGASDVLRAIEKHAGLKPAVIRTIRRQNPSLGRSFPERQFIREYRAAVRDAAAGKIAESFDRLDRLGCVRELPSAERRSALATEYLAALERGERALVVAQTWDEVRAVNDAIREKLHSAGRIGEGQELTTFQTLDLDSAQKRDARSYEPGQHAFFLRRYGRFSKSDLCEILGASERGVIIVKNGRPTTVGFRYAERLLVTRPATMEIAPGDRLQLKFNGRSVEGTAISNGELVTVHQLGADGTIAVESDSGAIKTLSPNQRLFGLGHAITSYASQGKTVDMVLISDSGCRAATSSNQFYVGISRARRNVMIFTENKAELRSMIQKPGDRALALDLKPAAVAEAQRQRVQNDFSGRHRRSMHELIATSPEEPGMRISQHL